MIESEMENKLLNKGFTAKNIAHMRKIISRDDTQKETYSSLLIDLKKRFFCGMFDLCDFIYPSYFYDVQ